MTKIKNVLSLFDGMSCGQIALNRAGIKYDKYFASEIDRHAIKVTMKNFPETIQIGDIKKVKEKELPEIDLILAGSPCQGFSFAGSRLNFNHPESKLFFDFVRILKEVKPKYFLLENVIMEKKHNDVISGMLGEIYPECVKQKEFFRTGRLEPIEINSALVSAQNRKRLYWTNINNIKQPKDRNILLKDVLQNGYGVIKINGKTKEKKNKSQCIDANYFKGVDNHGQRTMVKSEKNNIICIKNYNPSKRKNYIQYDINGLKNGSQDQRAYFLNGKHATLDCGASNKSKVFLENNMIRKLTPIECERLQTVPGNYTDCVSNTQRYKMIGNGWTVDVIAHILKHIK